MSRRENNQVNVTPQPSANNRFLDPAILASVSSLELLARTVVEGFFRGFITFAVHGVFDGVCGVSAIHARR